MNEIESVNRTEKLNVDSGTGAIATLGLFIGAILGYPISYYFQPDALRLKMSLVDYVTHICDVFQSSRLVGTAVLCMVICAIIGLVAGIVMGKLITGK